MSAIGQKKPYSQKKDQLKNEELTILRRIFSIFVGPGCGCRYTAIQLAKIFFSRRNHPDLDELASNLGHPVISLQRLLREVPYHVSVQYCKFRKYCN